MGAEILLGIGKWLAVVCAVLALLAVLYEARA
jgi:hypothetical protein